MIQVSLGAEDPEDDLPFIQAEDFLVVLDEAIVRAEVALAPSYECTWSEDFTGARGALDVLERDRARGADYDLAFIPRSPVTGGDAWELQAGEGEVTIFVASRRAWSRSLLSTSLRSGTRLVLGREG